MRKKKPEQHIAYNKNTNYTHNNVITPRLLKHVSYKLRGNRRSTLVLFVLSCVREERKDGSDAFRTSNLACMDHNAEFHERSVDLSASGVDNVHIVFSDRFDNADVAFANTAFEDIGFAEGDAQSVLRRESETVSVLSPYMTWNLGRLPSVSLDEPASDYLCELRVARTCKSERKRSKSGLLSTLERNAPVKNLIPFPVNILATRTKQTKRKKEEKRGKDVEK